MSDCFTTLYLPFQVANLQFLNFTKVKQILIGLLLCCYSLSVLGQIVPYSRNPKYNNSINPSYTLAINPNFTPSINPKFTPSINPKFTPAINPVYTININPQYNPAINPNFNFTLNPTYNYKLNPKYSEWTGQYMFNSNSDLIGFIVQASDVVSLYFTNAGTWQGYFVGGNYFSLDGSWTGSYLCSNSRGGCNFFNKEDEWTGEYCN